MENAYMLRFFLFLLLSFKQKDQKKNHYKQKQTEK